MPDDIKVNLHPVNFIILSGILQCVILGIILILYRKGKRASNRIIGLFILICSLHFSWSMVIDTNLGDVIKQLFWFPYSYLLALGPLLYLYTKSLTQHNFKFNSAALAHFMPVAIEFLVQLYFIRQGIADETVYYDSTGFTGFRIVQLTSSAISIVLYGKNALALIRFHEASLVENFSNQRDITLLWLYNLVKYLRVLWVFWLAFEVSFVLFLQFQMHFLSVYFLLYILLAIVTYSTYWIGLQTIVKSGTLIDILPAQIAIEKSSVYSRVSASDLSNYAIRLNMLMQSEKLYLHETLNLRMLSQRLDIEPNLVSHVLNNVLHKSFYDYVNEFRIAEVKRKIEDAAYSHLKIVEVAYECGFNSKATFNRVFKKVTGKSPSDFRKNSL